MGHRIIYKSCCASSRLFSPAGYKESLFRLHPSSATMPRKNGGRIVQSAEYLDKVPVIESGAGKMFYLLNIGQPLYHFIITASKPVHDRILFAAFFNSDYNFIAVLPFSDILWNQFHRILKIRYHTDHAVSGYLEHSIIGN